MRDYNKKIEDALALLQDKKINEASQLLADLVEEVPEKKELIEYIEIILTQNAKEAPETRETLKTFMSSITWRVAQGFGYR
jgi:thioredoxin-like negative regulator of GroEL